VTKLIKLVPGIAATVWLLGGGLAAAQQVASVTAPAATPTANAPAATPPMGGYLPQPGPSKQLVEKVWVDATGFALYVMNRECNGQCAVLFPPLTPAAGAKPPSKDWTVRVREENGDLQWVYKGRPVYTYTGDKPSEPPHADAIVPGIALAQK
jgi:predicted lipoprotein with Yx(FWY)xxD motif